MCVAVAVIVVPLPLLQLLSLSRFQETPEATGAWMLRLIRCYLLCYFQALEDISVL